MLTDAIEQLLHPLAKLHLPVHELAMMMTIALQMCIRDSLRGG